MCVQSRLALLEASQNPDGGWGYFPGRQSWLEPTALALLALSETTGCHKAFSRGLALLGSWALPDGGWRPCAQVSEAHWATSLVVTLYHAAGVHDGAFERGVGWLVGTAGNEDRPLARLAHWMRPSLVEFNPEWTGWPWQPGASSWVEPTAHALMALKLVGCKVRHPKLSHRVAVGERMLLDRRCRDGGWNYGNRRVLGADLPSYPETTALALLALSGNPKLDWQQALGAAERRWRETPSRLARAWLGACLVRFRGSVPPLGREEAPPDGDLVLAAVEAIPWDRILG